ncbi:MAG TPA: hypothetical protein VFF21_00140 [Flavobacteriaceae bacterium]|nr:hypothetical protein [Flavobacteriaceae bacterium]
MFREKAATISLQQPDFMPTSCPLHADFMPTSCPLHADSMASYADSMASYADSCRPMPSQLHR